MSEVFCNGEIFSTACVRASFIAFPHSGFRGRWPAKTTTGSLETLENPSTGKLLGERNKSIFAREVAPPSFGPVGRFASCMCGARNAPRLSITGCSTKSKPNKMKRRYTYVISLGGKGRRPFRFGPLDAARPACVVRGALHVCR